MSYAETLQPMERPLTPAEARLLDAKVRDLRARGASSPKTVLIGVAGVGILWLVTLLASDAPWLAITTFWLVAGAVIVLWVRRDARRDTAHLAVWAERLESALRADRAEVYDIRGRRFAELEEFEDEGACYAFEIADDRVVFVTGQEFYPGARFPSLDFSLVYPLDEQGSQVDLWIEKRGERAEPAVVVPARVKWELEIPEHLTVVGGRLDRLEETLRR